MMYIKETDAALQGLSINHLTVTIINVASVQSQDSSIKQTLVQAVFYGLIYCVPSWVDSCLQQLVQWLF